MASKLDTIPLSGTVNLPVPASWKATDQLNAYESWVYTAVNAIAQEIASINFKLYKKKQTKKGIEIEEVFEHEALSLLNEVNPYSNGYTHIFETSIYLELMGEAYWAVMRDAKLRPTSLWQLRPDYVSIIPSKDKIIDHYVYRVGTEEIRLEKEDVVPIRYTNPKTPYRGRSPVQSAAMAIDTDKFSAEWNRNFFFNSAMPNTVFVTDNTNLTREQVDKLKASWQANFGGRQNSHKVAFMTHGFKPSEVGARMKDMDFIEQRRAMRDEILGVFKVPKTVLGLTEDVNRANAEATTAAFIQRTIIPKVRMMVSYLNEFYLKLWADEQLFFDYEDPTPEDNTSKIQIYENGLKYGWLTINEVREQENLEPIDGGDVVYLPFGVTPMGENNNDTQQRIMLTSKSKSKRNAKINIPIPPKKLSELRSEAIQKELNRDLIRLVQLSMKLKPRKKDDKKEVFKENYWKEMIIKTDTQEQTMKEKLSVLFEEQEKEVLNKIGNVKGLKSYGGKVLARDLLFDMDKSNDEFRSIFAPFIRAIVEDRALEILDFVGSRNALDINTKRALDFLNKEGLKFIKNVNQTTKDKLLKQLSEGLKQSEGVPELSARVKSVYSEATTSRANMISRTEVLRATNFATEEAYIQSGVVEGKEWLTAIDERTCPSCGELDGAIIPLNKSFNSSEFGKVDFPPLHPYCRCTTIPVLDGVRAVDETITKNNNEDVSTRLDKIIEKKLEAIEKMEVIINEWNTEINNIKSEADTIKDEAIKYADEQKALILETARADALKEKSELTRELKELRSKVKEMIKDGQKP